MEVRKWKLIISPEHQGVRGPLVLVRSIRPSVIITIHDENWLLPLIQTHHNDVKVSDSTASCVQKFHQGQSAGKGRRKPELACRKAHGKRYSIDVFSLCQLDRF